MGIRSSARLLSALCVLLAWGHGAAAQSSTNSPGITPQGVITPGNCAKFGLTKFKLADAGTPCFGGASSFANPTALVGLTAVNGTALTAMRSDGAPALNATQTPAADSTSIINFTKQDGTTSVFKLDSSNVRAILGGATSGSEFLVGTTTANGNASFGAVRINGSTGSILDFMAGGTKMGRLLYDGTNLAFSSQSASVPVYLGINNIAKAQLQVTSFNWNLVGDLSFSNGAAVGTEVSYIGSAGTGITRLGQANAASPVAQTLQVQSVVAGTSNTAGQPWTLIGSLSTGNGLSGDIILKTGGTGAGATSQNASVNALAIKGATQLIQFLKSYTVATLPTCNAGAQGSWTYVTDASAPAYLGVLAGAGAVIAPAFCNGTNWVGG